MKFLSFDKIKFLIVCFLTASFENFCAQQPQNYNFSEIIVELANKENPQCLLDYTFPMARYRVEGIYPDQTSYRLKINCPENLNIYIIRAQNKDNAELFYSSVKHNDAKELKHTLEIPIEEYITIGKEETKEYLTVVFSDIDIEIEPIVDDISYASGDYYEKLRKTLLHHRLDINSPESKELRTVMNRAAFSYKDNVGIFPVTLEFFHQ